MYCVHLSHTVVPPLALDRDNNSYPFFQANDHIGCWISFNYDDNRNGFVRVKNYVKTNDADGPIIFGIYSNTIKWYPKGKHSNFEIITRVGRFQANWFEFQESDLTGRAVHSFSVFNNYWLNILCLKCIMSCQKSEAFRFIAVPTV